MRTIAKSKQDRLERGSPRGSALVEAALVISLIFLPMVFGIAAVGLNLIRANQANQLNRDAGHMFARGVDFSTANGSSNRGVLTKMAPALATTAGGTAVLILSHIIYVQPATCTTCPFTCSNCANLNHAVFQQQIVLGSSELRASAFGTVSAGSMDTTTGLVTDPWGNTDVRATGIGTYFAFGAGDGDPKDAYVAETYFSSADLAIPGFPSPAGTYARAFF